jgi:hypothetical protein
MFAQFGDPGETRSASSVLVWETIDAVNQEAKSPKLSRTAARKRVFSVCRYR